MERSGEERRGELTRTAQHTNLRSTHPTLRFARLSSARVARRAAPRRAAPRRAALVLESSRVHTPLAVRGVHMLRSGAERRTDVSTVQCTVHYSTGLLH